MNIINTILLLIIIFILACNQNGSKTNKNKTGTESLYSSIDTTINCLELTGTPPDLNIINNKYYGRMYLGISYDSINKAFVKYLVVRSTLYNKTDSSVFNTYQCDNKLPVPKEYQEIIQEVKKRIEESNLGIKRINKEVKCTETNWFLLPVIIK